MEPLEILNKFHINKEIGFMLKEPKNELPPKYLPWLNIALDIPNLVKRKEIRKLINELEIINIDGLKGFREIHLAFNVLVCMSSSYIFQSGDDEVLEILPKQISLPLYDVSLLIGLKPHVCHAAFVQSNYVITNNIRDIHPIIAMPGGDMCKQFIKYHAHIEIDAAPGIMALICAMDFANKQDIQGVIGELKSIIQSVEKMRYSLNILSNTVDPETFYCDIRPFLAGFGGQKFKYRNGIIFDGINENKPFEINGASAAQSCIMQSFDAGLQIFHVGERKKFLDSMLSYVLPAHKNFISYLRENANIRSFVNESDDLILHETFRKTIDTIKDFRSQHIRLVTKFIINMADLNATTDQYKSIAENGTGGQELMNFLKDVRNDTL